MKFLEACFHNWSHWAAWPLMLLAVLGLCQIIAGCGFGNALESRLRSLSEFLDG